VSPPRLDPAVTMPWVVEGTDRFLALVDGLDDDALRAPSGLPGWTRAHVVGHVARNAEALGRLVTWAVTGVETPMYASGEQRTADIEASAALPAGTLRDDVAATAARLATALAELPADRLGVRVRGATGRELPAAAIPWLRVREVWLHGLDLDAGASPSDLPAGMVDELLTDVTTTLPSKPGCPAARLVPTDRPREWHLTPQGQAPESTVTTSAANLATWLTGRHPLPNTPPLPPWL
jgi:maleylpyruvate isomerase